MPACPNYREAGGQPGERRSTAARRGKHIRGLGSRGEKPVSKGCAAAFDSMRLLPLELVDEQETWLCVPKRQSLGSYELESWPIDIEDELSFDDSESVSSVSVQCGEFEPIMVSEENLCRHPVLALPACYALDVGVVPHIGGRACLVFTTKLASSRSPGHR